MWLRHEARTKTPPLSEFDRRLARYARKFERQCAVPQLLLTALAWTFAISTDWSGTRYCKGAPTPA